MHLIVQHRYAISGVAGDIRACIDHLGYSSVAVDQNQDVYATTMTTSGPGPHAVCVFKHSCGGGGGGGGWVKVHSFNYGPADYVTLSVRYNQIKCCCKHQHSISVYTPRGELLHRYGRRGRGAGDQLKLPIICDDDSDGSVLIASYGTSRHRLRIMTEQGEFRVMTLDLDVSQQQGALLFDSHLYVTSWTKQTITKMKSVPW